MSALLTAPAPWAADVQSQYRLNRRSRWLGYSLFALITIGVAAQTSSTVPEPFSFALFLVLAGIAITVVRPIWGVYVTVFFAVVGDAQTSYWYPFTKNLSSRESILFVSDQLSLRPVELYLAGMLTGWVIHMIGTRRHVRLHRGNLTRPLAAFTLFLFVGLAYGVARGGDRTVALFEFRPLLAFALLYFVVVNLFEHPHQFRRLYWLVMAALTINSLIALQYFYGLNPFEREELESLGEHGASVQANAMLVLIAATWLFRDRSPAAKWLLPVMAVPVTWAYLLAERRAAMVALIVGFIVLAAVLKWQNRRRFWKVIPVLVIIGSLYTGAFWGAQGAVGFPAQAVKSVIAPAQQSAEDQQSDLYRRVENADIVATIQSNPVAGVGFGKPFLMPYPLPDVSFFVFWQFITHNSILWIWMKAGIAGFIAMLFLFGTAIRTGVRSLIGAEDGGDTAMTVTSLAFVIMFAVFAYVDIAWDTRNLIVLAIALAQVDRSVARRTRDAIVPAVRRVFAAARA